MKSNLTPNQRDIVMASITAGATLAVALIHEWPRVVKWWKGTPAPKKTEPKEGV